MKKILTLALAVWGMLVFGGRGTPRGCEASAMGEGYWRIWNDGVQAEIDAAIERNRKGNGEFAAPAADGTPVLVEQIAHAFRFGAHIFNYNQLGKREYNRAYKASYGEGGLFNTATVAFLWPSYEPIPGARRANGGYEDSEEFWNALDPDEAQDHLYWRRPAAGPVINFCMQRGVRVHGHVLVWGSLNGKPYWTWTHCCPEEEKERFRKWGIQEFDPMRWKHISTGDSLSYFFHWTRTWGKIFAEIGEEGVAELAPQYAKRMREVFRERIEGVAKDFGDLAESWDVVNESSTDWKRYRKSRTGKPVTWSLYGLMPADYQLNSLLDAKELFPARAKLAVNDYNISEDFVAQVADLKKEGARVDIVGCQMHIFNTNDCMRLAEGATDVNWVGTPQKIAARLDMMARTGCGVHVSELTITSPGSGERAHQIQATLARNLYRAWFAHPAVMGVTWWNTVDGCGVRGEPLTSGLFTRDMRKKAVYHALDELVNGEWKTPPTVVRSEGGRVKFRGFRGKYRLSWRDEAGTWCERVVDLDGAERKEGESAVAAALQDPKRFAVEWEMHAPEAQGEMVTRARATGQGLNGRVIEAGADGWFDIAAAAGVVLDGKDGRKREPVVLETEVDLAEDGAVDVYFQNDWWGRIVVDGKAEDMEHTGTVDGLWLRRRVVLEKGRHRIGIESRHGGGKNWKARFAVKSSLRAGNESAERR